MVEEEAGLREAEEGTYIIFLCGHVDMLIGIQYLADCILFFISICKLLKLSSEEDEFALV